MRQIEPYQFEKFGTIGWGEIDDNETILDENWALKHLTSHNFHVRWPREMNETGKFTSWPDKEMELKTRTIQNLYEDDTENQRWYWKSNLKIGGHMIYQNLRFKQTYRLVQKLDSSDLIYNYHVRWPRIMSEAYKNFLLSRLRNGI